MPENKSIGAIVLAGNAKIKKQIRRKKRRGLFHRFSNPRLWIANRKAIEDSLTSRINKDDYIVGENKSLLYLHPDLISQRNINFLKRVLYFAGKTGDRFYRKNKSYLLEYLSINGLTPISIVLKAMEGSEFIDKGYAVVIGPKKQLKRELERSGHDGWLVHEQGASIGQNILLGKKLLERRGYDGKEVLIIGGDLPLATPGSIDGFIKSASLRKGEPDIRFGMGSRSHLKDFIREHELSSMGQIGPNYPKKGYLNKFGIPLIDDMGFFGKKGSRDHFMMGNLFLARFYRISSRFIDRFYSLRKMGANPLTYPYLLWKFGRPLFRSVRWKVSATEAERIFSRTTDVSLKIAPVDVEMTLDLDSYSDMRRLSALYFKRFNTFHDLELDFKDFVKEKRKNRKKENKAFSNGGGKR